MSLRRHVTPNTRLMQLGIYAPDYGPVWSVLYSSRFDRWEVMRGNVMMAAFPRKAQAEAMGCCRRLCEAEGRDHGQEKVARRGK
jgi:hypothetical protein